MKTTVYPNRNLSLPGREETCYTFVQRICNKLYLFTIWLGLCITIAFSTSCESDDAVQNVTPDVPEPVVNTAADTLAARSYIDFYPEKVKNLPRDIGGTIIYPESPELNFSVAKVLTDNQALQEMHDFAGKFPGYDPTQAVNDYNEIKSNPTLARKAANDPATIAAFAALRQTPFKGWVDHFLFGKLTTQDGRIIDLSRDFQFTNFDDDPYLEAQSHTYLESEPGNEANTSKGQWLILLNEKFQGNFFKTVINIIHEITHKPLTPDEVDDFLNSSNGRFQLSAPDSPTLCHEQKQEVNLADLKAGRKLGLNNRQQADGVNNSDNEEYAARVLECVFTLFMWIHNPEYLNQAENITSETRIDNLYASLAINSNHAQIKGGAPANKSRVGLNTSNDITGVMPLGKHADQIKSYQSLFITDGSSATDIQYKQLLTDWVVNRGGTPPNFDGLQNFDEDFNVKLSEIFSELFDQSEFVRAAINLGYKIELPEMESSSGS